MALLLTVAACTTKPAPIEPAPSEPAASASLVEAVSCTDSIDHVTELPGDYRVVAGAVAVPTGRVLQASLSGEKDPAAKLFAKWGLMVRTGETVQITVAPGSTDKARVGWGAPGTPALTVRLTGCAPGSWNVFAGGTWVASPACVPLVIRAAGRSEQARLPVGVACT
jgi:hypothetical protein